MPRPKKTPEEIEAMRVRIIHAAIELFHEEGFDGISIRKIADRLGVSHMVIYTYFKNREALTEAFRDKMMAHMAFRYQEQLKRVDAGETLAVLRERLSQPIRTAREHPKMYAVAWIQPLPEGYEVPGGHRIGRSIAELAEIIRRGIEQGVCQNRDPELAAMMAMSMVLGPQILYVNGRLIKPELRPAISEESLKLAMSYLTDQNA